MRSNYEYVRPVKFLSPLSYFLYKEEIDRFEDEVIQGGPMALPGAAALVSQVCVGDH
jgi:hypothetical protein